MATIEKGIGTLCLGAFDNVAELKKHEFGRPAPGPTDVAIDILFCGMCHSDLHAWCVLGLVCLPSYSSLIFRTHSPLSLLLTTTCFVVL